MNHSILTADRNTHCKVVAVAIIAVLVIAVVGVRAGVNDSGIVAARTAAAGPAVKAGRDKQFTSRGDYTIR